jgi:hypothetical protein
MTRDLLAMTDWMAAQGVTPVAMESTGVQEFSWALSVQQRSGRLTAAMAGNCCGEIGQKVEALQVAGFGNGQQASRG